MQSNLDFSVVVKFLFQICDGRNGQNVFYPHSFLSISLFAVDGKYRTYRQKHDIS